MRRIVCLIVVGQMTADTGIRGRVIITVVAGDTIVCYCNVCTSQHVIIIVYREGSRYPVRIGGMTGVAGGGNTDGRMVRIGRRVIIRRMASGTGVGCIYVTPLVAGKAIVRNSCMGACKRVCNVMIKG